MQKILYTIFLITGLAIAQSAFALTVSPARVEITGDPGRTIYGEIEIFNEQVDDKTFYLSYENFEPSGDTGAPHFIGAEDDLATWISTDKSINLESGGRVIVPFSISIPANAEAGGHFGAIFFGNSPPTDQGSGQVSIGGKIGVLVLLRVTGDVIESGGLSSFNTIDEQRFFTTLPVQFSYRISNDGGDRIVPRGEIKIKNTFRLNSDTLLANKTDGSVLPASSRKFEVTWGTDTIEQAGFFAAAKSQLMDFHFGWYTAKLNLSWGETNQTGNASYNFFVIPWQLLSIILIVLIAVIFIGRAGIRKYNKFIIGQAAQYSKN